MANIPTQELAKLPLVIQDLPVNFLFLFVETGFLCKAWLSQNTLYVPGWPQTGDPTSTSLYARIKGMCHHHLVFCFAFLPLPKKKKNTNNIIINVSGYKMTGGFLKQLQIFENSIQPNYNKWDQKKNLIYLLSWSTNAAFGVVARIYSPSRRESKARKGS